MEPNSWSWGLSFFGVSKVHSWICFAGSNPAFLVFCWLYLSIWIFCWFDPERPTLGTTAWFSLGVPGWPLPKKPKRPARRFPATDSGGGMDFSYECLNIYIYYMYILYTYLPSNLLIDWWTDLLIYWSIHLSIHLSVHPSMIYPVCFIKFMAKGIYIIDYNQRKWHLSNQTWDWMIEPINKCGLNYSLY